MEIKTCKTCGKEKDISEFYKCRKWYCGSCIECGKLYKKEYYKNNRLYFIEKSAKWVKENRERFLKSRNERYENNREKYVQYRKDNKERIDKYNKEYNEKNHDKNIKRHKRNYTNNRDAKLEYAKSYHEKNIDIIKLKRNSPESKKRRSELRKKRYRNDICYRLEQNLRRRIHYTINGQCKEQTTKELLSCSLKDFKKHLESQFKNGMSWDNYGLHGWHIDHIRPCMSFDLSDIIQQRKCFHYSNLQPLWAMDNLSKGVKIS